MAYRIGAVLFIIYGLTSLSRVFFAFVFKPQLMVEMEPVNVVLFFIFCLSQPLLLFAFMLMVNLELTERLNEKIASQQKFYSIISHDLIGPVGSISQMLGMVNEPVSLTEKERNYMLKELEKMSDLTYHLLKNLLLWSRNQLNGILPTINSFDLNKVILQNVELQRYVSKLKQISILYSEYPGLMCRADEQMIDTVIRNLISNAIKFSYPEGEIVVECLLAGPNVQVKISDSGIGMSESTLKNLFVNHELVVKTGTGGEHGTGLGLMLCKNFVEDNFGSLKVVSSENVGTEVLVTLPVS
ncbi:MAG: HAMP domain-containing sensor histidine kinase [Prolixibacteraceae bacterium]